MMRKRRRKNRMRAYAILAVVMMIGVISVLGSFREKEETPIITESVVSAEEDYMLDIPLSTELQTQLYEASKEFGVDYYIMVALIDRETKFDNVIGDNGDSYGYCQIQPKWWYGLMVEIGATDLTEARDNFRAGCAIIAQLTEKYQSLEGALVAYNQGSYKGSSTAYSREVIENAKRYKA